MSPERKDCNNCRYSFREKGLAGLWCKYSLEYVEGYSPKDCEFFEDKRLIFEVPAETIDWNNWDW